MYSVYRRTQSHLRVLKVTRVFVLLPCSAHEGLNDPWQFKWSAPPPHWLHPLAFIEFTRLDHTYIVVINSGCRRISGSTILSDDLCLQIIVFSAS